MNGKNIVIIDDEVEILNMLEKFLSREGYSVKTFNNPLTAINMLSADTDVVLLDVMMPQMSGLDALPKILEKNSKVKVLIMTAYSTLDKVLKAHRNGADTYIMKPFDSLGAVQKKIEELLKS
ncbi:MAG: response regulator [Campylobacterales bacterium]|nr:response regulator [Campylobacterales bacterium]